MATTSATATATSSRVCRSSPSATCGCTSRAWAPTTDADVPIIVRGEGAYVWDEHGNRYLDGLSALFCVNAGHGRAGARRGGRAAGRRARLLHDLELRAPAGDRARDSDRLAGARRPEPRLLHLGRIARRSSRRSSSRAPTTSGPAIRARRSSSAARSPTTAPPSARWRPPASRSCATSSSRSSPAASRSPNTNSYRWPAGPRPALGGRPDRGEDPLRAPRHRRRGDPRAAPERRRLHPAAGGLLPAGARDLRPARRAADLRRGDLRLGPARPLVRLPALRLPARTS